MKYQQQQERDEIDHFFAQYLGFSYQREQPAHVEFYRMCDVFGWQRQPNGELPVAREEAWGLFRIAIVQAFNSTFGADVNNLASWKRICGCLGISPVPENLHEARRAVLRTHVNLVDLLESMRAGAPAECFATEEDLRRYTISEGKFFPKEEAYEGGLLRFLLREILHDYEGSRSKNHHRKSNREARNHGVKR